MDKECADIRTVWEACSAGTQPLDGTIELIRRHIGECGRCRAYVFQKGFTELLRRSTPIDAVAPSPEFFRELNRKLDAVDQKKGDLFFADMFVRVGLKVAPVMAVVVFFLSGTIAYLVRDPSSAATQMSIEDTVLYDEGQLNTDDILAAVFPGEVWHE